MNVGSTSGTNTLQSQARAVRRLHLLFGTSIIAATLALAATTSTGSQFFDSYSKPHNPSLQSSSRFADIDTANPLPLLLSQSDGPIVKGSTLDSDTVSGDTSLPSHEEILETQESANHFIKSFSFATIVTATGSDITFSWKTSSSQNEYLYVVTRQNKDLETEIYSVKGKGLSQYSATVSIEDSLDAGMFLSVYHNTPDGYVLVGTSALSKGL